MLTVRFLVFFKVPKTFRQQVEIWLPLDLKVECVKSGLNPAASTCHILNVLNRRLEKMVVENVLIAKRSLQRYTNQADKTDM